MDERIEGFVATFQTFLEEVVHANRQRRDEDDSALNPVVRQHLGADPRLLPVVTEDIPASLFVDLDIGARR